MKEAFRLLNKSIIRVETPDVNLDQEEETQMEVDEGPGGVNGEMFTWLFVSYRSKFCLGCNIVHVYLVVVMKYV